MPASVALRATRSIPSSTTGSTISANGRWEEWICRKSCWICWMALPSAKMNSSSSPSRAASCHASAAWKGWKSLSSVIKEATIRAMSPDYHRQKLARIGRLPRRLTGQALDRRVGGRRLQDLRGDRPPALEEAGHQLHGRSTVRRARDGGGQLAAIHHLLAALGQAIHAGVAQGPPGP